MAKLLEFATHHWQLVSIFFVLLALLFIVDRRRSGQSLSPQQATLLLNKGNAIMVDLRDQKEFSEGHIKGSEHIPFGSLKEKSATLDKTKTIIFVDKSGQHTGMAGKMLKSEGFVQVARMAGGIAEWKNSSLPLVKS